MGTVVGILVVALIATVSGGLAVPLGIAFGLHPLVVYAVAASTAIAVTWLLLLGGHRTRSLVSRAVRHGEHSVRRTDDFVSRYGTVGLGLIGPLFPGVVASILSGIALEVNVRHLGWWLTLGVVGWFGIFTALWTLARYAVVG